MKKLYKHLPAVIFGGFISVMLILLIVLPKKDFSSSEKRYLEKAPAFSLSAVFSGQFEKSFENFISDHTAGRNFWVGFNAYFNKAMGNNAPKGVYFGKDGYLINDPCEMTNFSRNAGYLEEFAADVKQRTGTPVTVAVAPSTGYVCADKLPKFHNTYHDDEAFAELRETFKTAAFADLRSCLQTAYADGNQVFYRTDHHWTTQGAYAAYRYARKPLKLRSEVKYKPYIVKNDFTGTLYSKSGFTGGRYDNITLYLPSSKTKPSVISYADTKQKTTEFYQLNNLKKKDAYTVFGGSNHPLYTVKTPVRSSRRLLLIKDSYANSFLPFLTQDFQEIVVVDPRYYFGNVKDLIRNEGVTDVLFLYNDNTFMTDESLSLML